ncbi:MAG: bifunctional homocysteine S-methyltransferase/methylenetetrahydrofolate reductase [Anaerolineales bacterium]|nr:bifunctional homocysteine S-methyltransferase/methylenetetrahydrofolate reductase [Anaerolineales bacterium]
MDEHPLNEWLQGDTPVLLDGAMGTMLHARGFSFDLCFDELSRTHPEEVASIHRAYLDAGAQIIETNTFGANIYKLREHGLEDHIEAINKAGVDLAREQAERTEGRRLVAGSVGPLGVRLAPFGRIKPDQAYEAFRQQIEALVEAGVDLLILETHSDVYELQEAIRAAKDLTDLPVIASMTFTRDDRTLLGDTASGVAESLSESGADILGANCSGGPAQLLRLSRQMKSAVEGKPICVFPNAGWPERVGDRIMYPATADYFADFARTATRAGTELIGGCCGTTPEHIRRMHAALQEPASVSDETEGLQVYERSAPVPDSPHQPTELSRKLSEGRFIISVEMDPPRGFSTHKVLAGAHLLADAGADVINVADSPMARMRMSPWAVCELIQRQVNLETVLHFPTRGRNLLRVQGDLLAAHALKVRNIFVVMGDPTAVGDYPEAMDNYDLVPTGLIKLIKHGFNSGVDHAGADIGGTTSFLVGCALNLGAQDLDHEVRLLHKKIASGADFALTQPVFDPTLVERFHGAYESRYGPLDLPILAGILPLYNERHAAFLHNEVPGIQIPDDVQDRMQSAGDDSRGEGVRIARELLETLRQKIQGVYLMPPFSRYDMAAEIIESLRSPAKTSS